MAKPRDPARILSENTDRALKFATKAGAGRVHDLMERAKRDLDRRLREAEGLGGPGAGSFTSTQMRVTLNQIEDVLRTLRVGLFGAIQGSAATAATASTADAIRYLNEAERHFRGVTQGLMLNEALIMDRVASGTEASVLRRLATSGEPQSGLAEPHPGKLGILDRYGLNVVGKFEEVMQARFIARTPWNDVRNELIEQSPFLVRRRTEEGAGVATRWAERILRTETMNAHNRAGWQTIREANDQLGDMIKILAATFDNRTAADSYAVHGQIRRPDEPFQSWWGSYMHPPNRPNDREVVVPHRMSWPLPASLTPKSDAEVAARWRDEGRKGSPPPRPKMEPEGFSRAAIGKAPPPPSMAEAIEHAEGTLAPPVPVAPAEPEPVRLPAPIPPTVAPEEERRPTRREPEPADPLRPPRRRLRTAGDEIAAMFDALDHLERLPRNRSGNVEHGLTLASEGRPWHRNAEEASRVSRALTERSNAVASRTAPAPQTVRIDRLRFTSPDLPPAMVEAALRQSPVNREVPVVVRYRGRLYPVVGAEAITAAHFEGRASVKAHVVDLDPPKVPKAKAKAAAEAGPAPEKLKPLARVSEYRSGRAAAGHHVSVSDPASTNEAARRIFGASGIPSVEALQEVWGHVGSGVSVQITSVSGRGGYSGSARVEFNGDLVMNGSKVGSIGRTFIRHPDGKLEVHHDLFKMNEERGMGKGSGEAMIRQSVQAYQQLGVHEITVSAAWVGPYAWATFGYDWDPSTLSYMKSNFGDFLMRNVPGMTQERRNAILRGIHHSWDLVTTNVDDHLVTTSFHNGHRTVTEPMKVGKSFILQDGGWSGTLSLDPNSPSYQRAKERCRIP